MPLDMKEPHIIVQGGKHICEMLQDQTIKRIPKCSSTRQKKTADFRVASKTNPVPLESPSIHITPAFYAVLLSSSQDGLGFSDRTYILASVIFQNIHLEKPPSHRVVNFGNNRGLPLPEVKGKEQLAAYELAFNALKYQEFLEDIIIDSFNIKQPMANDHMSLFVVMLYDFQKRKFLPRQHQDKGETIPEVTVAEKVILGFKTRLSASVARYRIKHDLTTIDCILPESVKMKQKRSRRLPIYTWVNTLKSSLEEVCSLLMRTGFSKVKSIGHLVDRTFCCDPHCKDTLVFPADPKVQVCLTGLLKDYMLFIQDKSCSLGPNVVCSLLPDDGDVLMAGCFSGLTVFHTASLIAEKNIVNGNHQPTVYVCVPDHTGVQRDELKQTLDAMDCKNVKLIPQDFQLLDCGDWRLQRLRIILLTPNCSLSAVSNPVERILQENRGIDLLQHLTQDPFPPGKMAALTVQQQKNIDHALKFPKVCAVVYSTCSLYPEENEEVVNRALEEAKTCSEQAGEPEHTIFKLSPLPFSISDHGDIVENKDTFFMVEPSEDSNGCFLAVLKREPPKPPVREVSRELILSAYAKDLLERIGANKQPNRKEQQSETNKKTKQTETVTPVSHLTVCSQSKSQMTNGSNGATLYRQHPVTYRQQITQGKAKPPQASKNAVPRSTRSINRTSSSFSKPEHQKLKKCNTSTLLPSPFHATQVAPVIHRPLRSVALVLPVVQLPPPQWKPPTHPVSICSLCHSKTFRRKSRQRRVL